MHLDLVQEKGLQSSVTQSWDLVNLPGGCRSLALCRLFLHWWSPLR